MEGVVLLKGKIDLSDVKRCYVDIQYMPKCPGCGKLGTIDLSDRYISYPEVNTVICIGAYCDNCDNFFNIPGKVASAELILLLDTSKSTIE